MNRWYAITSSVKTCCNCPCRWRYFSSQFPFSFTLFLYFYNITPYYVHLGLLKFRDIVKIYNCLFLYDYVSDNKPCNFPLFLVSEQHNYFTRSASAQQLHIPHSRINIRKFCPTVIGKYYWNDLPLSIRNKSSKILFKKALKNIILFNIDLCACVCACVRVCVLMNKKAI